MCSLRLGPPFRYSDDYRDAQECYDRAVADGGRGGATGSQKFNAFKRRTFHWRLLSAFEEGLHYVHVYVHTSDGLVQCTCGLICRNESELRRSDGHRNMTTWEIDGVVILRVGRLGQGRPEHAVDVAKCQRCGLAGPVQELGAAKFWRANHQCRFTAPEPYGTGTASLVSAP